MFKNYFLCFTEHFTCIIKVLFTLLYTQALAALSVKCSAEDRMAWKQSGALKKVGYVIKTFMNFCLCISGRSVTLVSTYI